MPINKVTQVIGQEGCGRGGAARAEGCAEQKGDIVRRIPTLQFSRNAPDQTIKILFGYFFSFSTILLVLLAFTRGDLAAFALALTGAVIVGRQKSGEAEATCSGGLLASARNRLITVSVLETASALVFKNF